MNVDEIWKRFQEHMAYTDEDLEIFRTDPEKVKMVTQTPEMVKCRVVAEVIESHGCHAHHRVGDRLVMTPAGQLLAQENPKRICVSALCAVSHVIPAIQQTLMNKSDPDFEQVHVVQCPDVGLDKGGWGKILMKVYVEKHR